MPVKLVNWPLMGGLLHLVQREGDWATQLDVELSWVELRRYKRASIVDIVNFHCLAAVVAGDALFSVVFVLMFVAL